MNLQEALEGITIDNDVKAVFPIEENGEVVEVAVVRFCGNSTSFEVHKMREEIGPLHTTTLSFVTAGGALRHALEYAGWAHVTTQRSEWWDGQTCVVPD